MQGLLSTLIDEYSGTWVPQYFGERIVDDDRIAERASLLKNQIMICHVSS